MDNKKNYIVSLKHRDTNVRNEATLPKEGKKDELYWVKASELSDRLKPYIYNRGDGKLDEARVRRIAKSIIGSNEIPPHYNGTDWLISPIIVNKKTDVIVDGHYTKAALEYVYENEGWDIEALVIKREFPKGKSDREIVSSFNNMRKPWTAENYIECYVSEGVEDYVKLKNAAISLGYPFVNKGGKPNYRYIAALTGTPQAGNLKNGRFIYTDAIMERGKRVKELFDSLNGKRSSSWLEAFIIAYCNTFEGSLDGNVGLKVLKSHMGELDWFGDTGKVDYWQNQFRRILTNIVSAA